MFSDGTNVTRLTNNQNRDLQPHWSPDSSQIIFASNNAADGSGQQTDWNVFRMNGDGSGLTPVTTSPGNEVFADIK
jgi:Tol biopolymer transport system component